MSPVEVEVVRRKLATIVVDLKALEPIGVMGKEDYIADKLAPSAGLRNRLVHEYDMLDHAVVLKAVATGEEMFSKYVKEINDYLSKEK